MGTQFDKKYLYGKLKKELPYTGGVMRRIRLNDKELRVSDIHCIYHVLIDDDPGVVIRILNEEPLPYFFRTRAEREKFWLDLRNALSNEFFITSANAFFRPEAVEFTDITIKAEPLPYITIGFHGGYAIQNPYSDSETMMEDYKDLSDILAQLHTLKSTVEISTSIN